MQRVIREESGRERGGYPKGYAEADESWLLLRRISGGRRSRISPVESRQRPLHRHLFRPSISSPPSRCWRPPQSDTTGLAPGSRKQPVCCTASSEVPCRSEIESACVWPGESDQGSTAKYTRSACVRQGYVAGTSVRPGFGTRPATYAHTGQSDHTTHHLCFPPMPAARQPSLPFPPAHIRNWL